MEIGPKSKIADLIKAHPFLLDYLVEQSPEFARLKNPLLRKTLGKVATVQMAASMGGLNLGELLAGIAEEIRRQGGEPVRVEGVPLTPAERQEALKAIVRDLHQGHEMAELKQRFSELIQNLEAGEVAKMEQALLDEGMEVEEVRRLCDVHVELFRDALEEGEAPQVEPGHPVHTYMEENRALTKLLDRLQIILGEQPEQPFAADIKEVEPLLERIAQVDIHYQRKENQLFPLLEAHHFVGPSQVMWSKHDEIRGLIKEARRQLAGDDPLAAAPTLRQAVQALRDMIYKEERILFPASLEMLSDSEWLKMAQGEKAVGYAWVEPAAVWQPQEACEPAAPPSEALLMQTGRLTLEQVNLLLNHLPLDLTFVDASDQVAFYSEGAERIFTRSPAIIGRSVQNCHPPASLEKVNRIVEAFKSGERSAAEFWIELKGRLIHIRYFALRDSQDQYQGTLEVTQDVTDIKGLEGERRLLDWQ